MQPMPRSLAVTVLAASLLAALPSQAVTLEVAQQVIDRASQLPRPGRADSEFKHWTYNTALFTAGDCWLNAAQGKPFPAVIAKFGPTRAGSHTGPTNDERERVCSSIAKNGFAPVCTHGTFWVENGPPAPLLPPYYLAFQGDPNAVQVRGALGCYLTADQAQKQTYIAQLTVAWATPVRPQQVNLPSGTRMLNMGTVMVTAPDSVGMDGKPYQEPRNIVQY